MKFYKHICGERSGYLTRETHRNICVFAGFGSILKITHTFEKADVSLSHQGLE